MKRKRGLSIERHQEIGLELARIQDRLTSIAIEIATRTREQPGPPAGGELAIVEGIPGRPFAPFRA